MIKLGPYLLGPNDTPENGIYTGDAKILAEAIPDSSVDLIFADPVYQNIDDYYWLAEMAAKALRPDGHLLVFVSQQHFLEQAFAINKFLKWGWLFSVLIAGRRVPMWQKKIQSCGQFIAWFVKSSFDHFAWAEDFATEAFSRTDGYKWRKGIKSLSYYVHAFCKPNGIVLDPFGGGGTALAVCKMLGRNYLAFEIDPAIANLARVHVYNTQSPLPGLIIEQLTLYKGGTINNE